MLRRIFLVSLLLTLLLPAAVMARRYTVIVSLDGFRNEYTHAYRTPFLDSLGRMGVTATMQPSFPSKTFPNHYTLATGLVPDHHGIIANKFLDEASGLTFSLGNKATKQDPRFWGGEPVWNTASRQGKRVGVVYWPGSDVKIGGKYPYIYHNYEEKPLLSFAQRVVEVGRMLSLSEDERPDLVMAYFEEPDHSGHFYGPMAAETRSAVERIDGVMEMLWETLQTLPIRDSINLIVTADHGMTAVDTAHMLNPYDYVPEEWVERIQYDLPTHIWPKKGCEKRVLEALQHMPHARIWRKGEVPEYLHYGSNPNIGTLVLLPDMGWTVGTAALRYRGTHGYDPTGIDMQVLFRAAGPDFRHGYERPGVFANTSVYPLLCHLLGIAPAQCDGTLAPAADLLSN